MDAPTENSWVREYELVDENRPKKVLILLIISISQDHAAFMLRVYYK